MIETKTKDYFDYVLVGASILIETTEGELFRTHVIRRCYTDPTKTDMHYVDYGRNWEHTLCLQSIEPGIHAVESLNGANVKAYAIFDNRI